MEIRLAPDQEAHLAALAARRGRSADEIVGEAVIRLLDDEARCAGAVELGVAATDRGGFATSEVAPAGVAHEDAIAAAERIHARRRGVTLGGIKIKDLITEGRR